MAEMTGKEAALFVLTGTMSNFLAVISGCGAGDEILVGDKSHLGNYEQGNVARFGGIPFRTIPTQPDGTLSLDDVAKYGYFASDDFHLSHTRMVCLENTHNYLGGVPLPFPYLEELFGVSREKGFLIHTDGARIINAAIAQGSSLKDVCQFSDSVSMCFTKGLGCPFGGVLLGNGATIAKARRARKAIGGQWRQGGIAAAACLHSIRNTAPIAVDHSMALSWAEGVRACCPNIHVQLPASNIVLLHCESEEKAARIIHKMEQRPLPVKLQFGASGHIIRAVFHRSVDFDLLEQSVQKLQKLQR